MDALLRILLLAFTLAVDKHHRAVIDDLRAENRVLVEQLGGRKPRFTDAQRIRLATKEFKSRLKDDGVKVLTLASHSPNLNAFAERFVLSIKSECLSKIIPLSERHLRHAVTEFIKHFDEERPHQGLGNCLLGGHTAAANDAGPIQHRERVGGLLKFYHRDAA